jgi:hypothetical protein
MSPLSTHDLVLARTAAELGLNLRTRTRPAAEDPLTRVRRGAYVDRDAWASGLPSERYAVFVRATVTAMRRPAPLSHESAAVMLGIPVVGAWPRRTHVTEEAGSGGRSSSLITRHGVAKVPDVVTVQGLLVTSAARTVVDLAKTRSFASGLASADHALATGLCTREELLAEVERARGTRGLQRARSVVERADPRSESVGESLSRARMYELRLPIPELQHEFSDASGFIGRTDYWWRGLRLIGEFDGRVKFGVGIAETDGDVREALWQEKRREDRLRALGIGVVRWGWTDAFDVAEFARIMGAAGVHATPA